MTSLRNLEKCKTMKLLKKSTVTLELNTQKKMQIDEGVMIAGKIDALRKTLTELETQHQNFAQGKKKELISLLGSIEKDIEDKKSIVLNLEYRKREALKPLKSEWDKIEKREAILKEDEKFFSKKLHDLNRSQLDVTNRDKELAAQFQGLAIRIRENETMNKKAKNNIEKSKEILESSLNKEEEINVHVASKTQKLLSREAGIASRERELDIKQAHLENREREIINQRIRLEDREATLEREITRRKNK